MVGRPDVHVVGLDALLDLARDRLRLRLLLRLEPRALEHVLEVHVAAEVELVGAVDRHPAVFHQACEHPVRDRGAHLALDVVADDRDAGVGEALRPLGIAGDEHRDRVHERDAGLEAGVRVVALRVLGADRQVAHEHLGARVAEDLRDVDRRCRRLLDDLAVVLPETVERGRPLHLHAEPAHVGESDRVVLRGEDRLAEVEADLRRVDVERGDELDVAHVVAAEHHVHQTGYVVGGIGVAVVLDALHQAARAVPDAGDGDTDSTTHDAVAPLPRELAVRSAPSSRPSAAMSASIHSRSRWVDCVRCSNSERA